MDTPKKTASASLAAAVKDAHACSWYRVARLLAVTDQSILEYRHGRINMSDETALRACELAGKSPRETAAILAALQVDRARDEKTREAWAAVLKRLGGLAAGVLLAIGANGPTPPAAHAAAPPNPCVLCKPKRGPKRRRATWADSVKEFVAHIIRPRFFPA